MAELKIFFRRQMLVDLVDSKDYIKSLLDQPVSTFVNISKIFDMISQILFKRNGILLPKLLPTVRKKCSSDRENLLKFKAEG